MNWDQGEDQGRPVRSPHSIAMTVLSRSGAIGLALWLVVLIVGFGQILRATALARRSANHADEVLGVWFLAYLSAILIVALFGVVLEAPHGAVPFFLLLGLGVGWSTDIRQSLSAANVRR
jgi:O-antigen ligase